MRVLITRPLELALPLAEKIKVMGMEPEIFPVIEIQPTSLQSTLCATLKTLNAVDIAIWVSQAAVNYSAPLIHQHWKILPPVQWAAIGAGTAQALEQHGLKPVIVPKHPPYESEALLALSPFQTVKNQKILIFRGNGGRNLLMDTLQQRGATVQAVETYQRCLPKVDMVERLAKWRHTSTQVIVTTSADSLKNFVQMVGSDISWLKNIPVVVVGVRMLELANQLDFKRTLLAQGAEDDAIIQVLQNFKEASV